MIPCRRLRTSWALAAALLAPATAAGREPVPEASNETVQLGLRTMGWSFPVGRMNRSGRPVSEAIRGAFPLLLDLGGKLTRHVFVGGYLGFNAGRVGEAFGVLCAGSVSCSANNVRIGLQVQVHLRPARRLNPWVGLGFGTEATTITAESRVGDYTQTVGGTSSFQGIELLHATLGLDHRAAEVWGYGPYVTFTAGRYETTTVRSVVGTNRTSAIEDPSIHHWILFGFRGVLFP